MRKSFLWRGARGRALHWWRQRSAGKGKALAAADGSASDGETAGSQSSGQEVDQRFTNWWVDLLAGSAVLLSWHGWILVTRGWSEERWSAISSALMVLMFGLGIMAEDFKAGSRTLRWPWRKAGRPIPFTRRQRKNVDDATSREAGRTRRE